MNDLTPPGAGSHQALVEKVDAHLDATWARLDAATHPLLERAGDLTKTVISLSAGALVLSLSVTQLLQDRSAVPTRLAEPPASDCGTGGSRKRSS